MSPFFGSRWLVCVVDNKNESCFILFFKNLICFCWILLVFERWMHVQLVFQGKRVSVSNMFCAYSLNGHIDSHILLTIKPWMVNIYWACTPISFNHIYFWHMFLASHQTTYHPNIDAWIRIVCLTSAYQCQGITQCLHKRCPRFHCKMWTWSQASWDRWGLCSFPWAGHATGSTFGWHSRWSVVFCQESIVFFLV